MLVGSKEVGVIERDTGNTIPARKTPRVFARQVPKLAEAEVEVEVPARRFTCEPYHPYHNDTAKPSIL